MRLDLFVLLSPQHPPNKNFIAPSIFPRSNPTVRSCSVRQPATLRRVCNIMDSLQQNQNITDSFILANFQQAKKNLFFRRRKICFSKKNLFFKDKFAFQAKKNLLFKEKFVFQRQICFSGKETNFSLKIKFCSIILLRDETLRVLKNKFFFEKQNFL